MKYVIGDCLLYTAKELQIKGQPKIKEIKTQRDWQRDQQNRTRQVISIKNGMYEFRTPKIYHFTTFMPCKFIDDSKDYEFNFTFNRKESTA